MGLCLRKEGNVLSNDALNTLYLQLYGIGHMVKDHSARERIPTPSTWCHVLAIMKNNKIHIFKQYI